MGRPWAPRICIMISLQRKSRPMPRTRRLVIITSLILSFQILCGLVFTVELFSDVLGLRSWTLRWQAHELVQLTAVLGLILGTAASIAFLVDNLRRAQTVERQLQAASGALHTAMQAQFEEWCLSPAEADVALYAVKGCANAQIAELRGKSEATIKTQINAVFRKAGVQNRGQLIAQFLDLLLDAPAS